MTQAPAPAGAPPGADPAGADVFISYARENRALAEQLAEALAAEGLRVWWDREILAGSEFSTVIETELDGARVVVALWSEASVRSAFVRDECARALRAGKLLPVRVEDVDLPLGFGQIHTLDLLDWASDADAEPFRQLVAEVQRRKAGPAAVMGERRRVGRGRMHPMLAVLLVGAAVAIVGYGGYVLWRNHTAEDTQRRERIEAERKAERSRAEADRHFRAGLEHQFAPEPALVPALNEYLSALEYRPGHARARYYLGHVYAQLGQLADALASFKLALAGTEALLDNSLRAEASKQVAALSVNPTEASPVARATPMPPPPEPRPGTSGPGRGTASGETPRTRTPPPSRPSSATVARLDALVDTMFDTNKDKRIAATTSLVVDPDALSDAVPIAVARALAAVREPGELSASASSGVVNTLVLLQSASPSTLQVNRGAIEQLIAATRTMGTYTRQQADKVATLLEQSGARRPVVYLQIADEAQRPLAQSLADRFQSFGYDTPGVEVVGSRAPELTEVRLQGRSERSFARWVSKVVGEMTGETPEVVTLRNARPKADTYEVWLDRDLCAPGGRQVAACGGAHR